MILAAFYLFKKYLFIPLNHVIFHHLLLVFDDSVLKMFFALFLAIEEKWYICFRLLTMLFSIILLLESLFILTILFSVGFCLLIKVMFGHTIAPKKNWVLGMGEGFLTHMTFKPKNLSKPKTQTQTQTQEPFETQDPNPNSGPKTYRNQIPKPKLRPKNLSKPFQANFN